MYQPTEMSFETLLNYFERYGEIEEGLGVWYGDREIKESAKAALTEKVKFVDSFRLVCKMVSREGRKLIGIQKGFCL